MPAVDFMNDRATVFRMVRTPDGRGGYTNVEILVPGAPAGGWPVQVAQPTAVERMAAGNDVAALNGSLRFPPNAPVEREDIVIVSGDGWQSGRWRVLGTLQDSRQTYLRAECARDQDEQGEVS